MASAGFRAFQISLVIWLIALHSRRVLRIPVASLAVRWSLIGLAAICALGLLALVFIVALDKEVDAWSRIALFAIAISACVATFLVSPPEWDPADIPGSLAKPKFLAVVIAALFVSFEMTSNAVGMFSPREVVESEPQAIENTVKDTNRMVAEMTRREAGEARTSIEGLWGETAACEVAYRFTFAQQALSISRVKGGPPFERAGRIVAETGNSVVFTSRSTGSKGLNVELTVEDDGMAKRLYWKEEAMDAPLKLESCQ